MFQIGSSCIRVLRKPPLIAGISFETPITVLSAHLALLPGPGAGAPHTAANAQRSHKPHQQRQRANDQKSGSTKWALLTEKVT